jgi:hypothetical protein
MRLPPTLPASLTDQDRLDVSMAAIHREYRSGRRPCPAGSIMSTVPRREDRRRRKDPAQLFDRTVPVMFPLSGTGGHG